MMNETIAALNLGELEERARAVLSQMAYGYYASGANDEVTLRENRTAYERIALLPRTLVDVSARAMDTTVLGQPVSMPILIAPAAFQGLAHPDGELATTKAAGTAETVMTFRPTPWICRSADAICACACNAPSTSVAAARIARVMRRPIAVTDRNSYCLRAGGVGWSNSSTSRPISTIRDVTSRAPAGMASTSAGGASLATRTTLLRNST